MNKGTKKVYELEYSDEFMNNSYECGRNHAHSRRFEKHQSSKAVRRWNKRVINSELALADTAWEDDVRLDFLEDFEKLVKMTSDIIVFDNEMSGISFANVSVNRPMEDIIENYEMFMTYMDMHNKEIVA